MSAVQRVAAAVCAKVGHADTRPVMLPEDIFGLYAYSRIECSRCGATLEVGWTDAMQIARLTELLDECRAEKEPGK